MSKIFNISIDELLSSEEIIDIAENENVSKNYTKIYNGDNYIKIYCWNFRF